LQPFPFSGHAVYRAIFWIAFTLWLVTEGVASRLKRSTDRSKARDRGSLYLILILWWIGMALDFSLSFLLPQAAISWRRTELFFTGIALMLAGIALRLYAMALLGRYFTFDVAVHVGQKVIEAGPYRYIRHPSYSGALLTLAGFGLALGNLAGLAAALACLGFAYSYRIPVEEAALVAVMGAPYEQYMHRTWRLVPFLF
jgi:protein-S-isoprenylcysteine O-methyltransferase Ste14